MSDTPSRPRRRIKKVLIATGVLVTALVVLAALAPWLVNRGVGHGFVRGRLERSVSGTVTLGKVELGWFGAQSIKGFEINGADGATAVRVDATLDAGLLDLALGRVEVMRVELAGSARGELRDDGSTSIDDLLRRPGGNRDASARREGPPAGLPDLAGVPPVTIVLAGLTVALTDPGSTREILRLDDLAGELKYTPGERLDIELDGRVGDGVTAGTVHVGGRVAGLYDAGGAVTPARASGRVEVNVRDAPVPMTDLPTELALLDLVVTTDDPTKSVQVTVTADAMVDGTRSGNLEGLITVDSPLDARGVVSFGLDRVSGGLNGESMPTALVQRFLRATPIVATRDFGPLMDVDAVFSTGTTRRITVGAKTDAVTLDLKGEVDPAQRFTAERCRIEATLRPELVQAITGVRIEREAPIVVDLTTLERGAGIVAKGTVRLGASVAVADGPAATLLSAVLDETLAVDVDARLDDEGLRAKLAAKGDEFVANGTATLKDGLLDVIEATGSMKVTPAMVGALSAPTRVTVQVSPMQLTTKVSKTGPGLPPIAARVGLHDAAFTGVPGIGGAGVTGEFAVTLDDTAISIAAENVGLTLPRAALQQRMGKEITVVADVPLTLTVRSLRLPRAALSGATFKGADADVDLVLAGGPVELKDDRTGRNTIRNIQATLRCGDLAEDAVLKITGDIGFSATQAPGALQVDGTITKMMADGRLTASRATIGAIVKISGLHTAVVDGLADMQGLLVAAVGPRIDAMAYAEDLSRLSGTLSTRIQASNGWLDGKASAADDALVVHAESPVTAELELTPPLRQRLLYKIHPLLADIRTTEQPMRATVGASSIPLDGDVSRLDAKLEITIGKVEIDSGTRALGLLTLARATDASTLQGEITPIKATIRKGILTYDKPFGVRIDKYLFVYTGTIDLNRRYVDLVTEVPLEGLAGTFQELEGYTGDARIRMFYRGPFGDVRPEIDQDRLAEVMLEVGIRRGIGELEKEIGIPIGEILDGLFGKKKKKE